MAVIEALELSPTERANDERDCTFGGPTWSYLCRRHVGGLAEAGYRAVASEQISFGRSDKPPSRADYSLERHLVAILDFQRWTP